MHPAVQGVSNELSPPEVQDSPAPLLPSTPSTASRNPAVPHPPAPQPKPAPAKRYILFCGAPSSSRALEEVRVGTSSYAWEVATTPASGAAGGLVVELSSEVLEEAERRLGSMCETVSFVGREVGEEEEETAAELAEGEGFEEDILDDGKSGSDQGSTGDGEVEQEAGEGDEAGGLNMDADADVEESRAHLGGHGDETTAITWAPTTQGGADDGPSIVRRASLTFLHPSQSHLLGHSTAFTQYTQETASYAYSDASSIARFPAFHFNPHALLPLATLLPPSSARDNGEGRGQRKANVLAAVLEADGPHTVRVRRGPDAGREVSVLRLVLGDAVGGLARLAAWREVADAWADAGVRRGDVVHLENVLASRPEAQDSGKDSTAGASVGIASCTASPQLKSRLLICYRTMPTAPADARLRPDLRLGLSDAGVRHVAELVRWVEEVAGIA